MKLINRPKKEVLINETWALAIKKRFGDEKSLLLKFSPNVQEFCADRVHLLCPDETIPTLVRISIIYGEKTAETLLNMHITEALLTMGEKSIDENEVKAIARTIRADENLKTLKVPMLLTFFKKLKSGQYKIYGNITCRKILESMQEFFNEAIELQKRYYREYEEAEKEKERAEHRKHAMTWEEYAKKNNINQENPINKLTK